jgi:hypothetical protein
MKGGFFLNRGTKTVALQENTTPLPLIQVASQEELEQLIDIVGLTPEGTQKFDDKNKEPNANVRVILYSRGNKKLGVLSEVTPRTMCWMARHLNEHRAKYNLKKNYKRILNVKAHKLIDATQHHPLCRYLTTVEQVERYLEITVAKPEELEAWFKPRITEQRVAPRIVFAAFEDEFGGVFGPGFVDGSGAGDFPDAVPAAPKKLKVDRPWEDLLKPKQQLKTTECKELQCGCCCDFQKTIACVPCGHVYYCDECFRGVLQEPKLAKTCPLCRNEIDTIVRINL